MDIVVWLRSLGLGKYEAAFRENDIDETVLPGLTHETLKELGVASIGHRVKLLDAIAALRNDTSAQGPSSDLKTAPAAPSAPPEDRAERRQVTVMFSDLVGSTALSARMDPEDLREVISAYQKCIAETVQRANARSRSHPGTPIRGPMERRKPSTGRDFPAARQIGYHLPQVQRSSRESRLE
jgi:class 3 adenylate cyclase